MTSKASSRSRLCPGGGRTAPRPPQERRSRSGNRKDLRTIAGEGITLDARSGSGQDRRDSNPSDLDPVDHDRDLISRTKDLHRTVVAIRGSRVHLDLPVDQVHDPVKWDLPPRV